MLVEVTRPHAPTTLDPMPSHTCYRAASNVTCQVATVTSLEQVLPQPKPSEVPEE